MFTGIITGVGRIVAVHPLGFTAAHGLRLGLQTPPGYLDDVVLGDSIAINGACMTAVLIDTALHRFSIDISAESLACTAGLTTAGSAVNLEKALRASDRLGGHIVSGHVDGIGHVTQFAPVGESWTLQLQAPAELAKYFAYKGSITVNGVSLTVNKVQDTVADAVAHTDTNPPSAGASPLRGCAVFINLIPHTVHNTALGQLKVGDAVNLEIDLIARYVERMLQGTVVAPPTLDTIRLANSL